MTQTIKLMTDYYCYPLWWAGGDKIGNIDPRTLPLSQKLIQSLEQWQATYDGILDLNDPASAGFTTRQEAEQFEQDGIRLWKALQQELAPDYKVVYFSDRAQKVITDPQELPFPISPNSPTIFSNP